MIIHGLMGNGKSWVPTANRLQNQFNNNSIQCLVVDLRHHNKSALKESPKPNTIESCAEDLKNLCEELHCYPHFVVGNSFIN